jgi:hypothetical protein
MAAPPGVVFALPESSCLGRIQDLLDTPRTREAVSALLVQSGLRIARMSSVVIVSTGLPRSGAAPVSSFSIGLFRSGPNSQLWKAEACYLHSLSEEVGDALPLPLTPTLL